MGNRNYLHSIHWSIIYVVLIFLAGCSGSPNGSTSASISGQVVLENQDTHEGVTVALYQKASADSLTEALVRQYFDPAFFLSQSTLFDHRTATLIAQTTTDASGNFKLENVPTGQFNVVAQKAGFGWKYVFDVEMNGSQQTLPVINLKEEREVQGTISGSATWERDRHYIVKSDITVPEGATLTIEPGVVVRFDGFYRMVVRGDLDTPNNTSVRIWLTSNRSDPQIGNWNGLVIEDNPSSVQVIKNCKIDFANTAIDLTNSSGSIEFCVMRRVNLGVHAFSSTITVENSKIDNCVKGIEGQNGSNLSILGNLFAFATSEAINPNLSNSVIVDNLFIQNEMGILGFPPGDLEVRNNLFDKNKTSVRLERARLKLDLSRNTFRRSEAEAIFAKTNSYPVVNFNNFVDNTQHVVTVGVITHNDTTQTEDIDAKFNWWGTTNPSEIRSKIKDGNQNDSDPWLGKVIFDPIAQSEILDAYPGQ